MQVPFIFSLFGKFRSCQIYFTEFLLKDAALMWKENELGKIKIN